MISRRQLVKYGTRPASAPWALDSGGFTELSTHGRWTIGPAAYAAEADRWRLQIGNLRWAAIQDWMCEDFILARTGRTVPEHQASSVRSLLELRDLAPEVPWLPVLQGQTPDDYLRCAEAYEQAGLSLTRQPLVGIGSVCRRQNTAEAEAILRRLEPLHLRLHGFGMKTLGFRRYAHRLASADSMAWSFQARKKNRNYCGSPKHANCTNCLAWALTWRERILTELGAARQLELFPEVA